MALNNVFLMGRLVRDPEIRYTEKSSMCKFTLAVDRPKTQKGQQKAEADFIACVAWGKTAETIANYFSKGSRILINGTIRTGSYENKQGQKVYTTDIWVNGFEFIDFKSNDNRGEQGSSMEDFGSPMNVDF